MEPPLKRMRVSKDDNPTSPTASSPTEVTRSLPSFADINEQQLKLAPPTRTIPLDAFRRRSLQDAPGKKGVPVLPNAGVALLRRAPDATVTASVVEIAVNDNSAITQITVPTDPTAIALPNLGTVTVPGLDSTISDITSHVSRPTVSPSDGGSSISASDTNSTITSSNEHTATVTATSTLHLSYKNGTFIFHSTSHSNNSFTTDVTTTDDSSVSSTSAYVFGDGVTYTPSTSVTYSGAGAHGIASATTSSSSDPSPASNGTATGIVLTQQQAQVVGGVVGSVAGVALVLVIILYVLRWYRQRLKCQGRLPEQLSSGEDFGNRPSHPSGMVMSQSRQSMFLANPFAQSLQKWRTHSEYAVTTSTTSTAAPDSEKGFQKIAGRKIPSVLSEGGDGFGGNFGAFEKETSPPLPENSPREHNLSRSSFYRNSGGIYTTKSRPTSASVSEPGTPSSSSFSHPMASRMHRVPSFSTFGTNTSSRDFAAYPANLNNIASAFADNSKKPDGYAMMRSSPARTPVTQSPITASHNFPMMMHASVTMDEDVPEMPLPPPPIGLGLRPTTDRQNSHVSVRTGSSAGGKFKENI